MLVLLPGQIRRKSLPDLLRDIDPGVAPGPRDEQTLRKTVGFVDSLLKYRVFQRYGTCFLRSLTLFHFLRLQGWPVSIHFGVRRADEANECDAGAYPGHPDYRAKHDLPLAITGHCWLMLEDKPFLEDQSQHKSYSTTYRFS